MRSITVNFGTGFSYSILLSYLKFFLVLSLDDSLSSSTCIFTYFEDFLPTNVSDFVNYFLG